MRSAAALCGLHACRWRRRCGQGRVPTWTHGCRRWACWRPPWTTWRTTQAWQHARMCVLAHVQPWPASRQMQNVQGWACVCLTCDVPRPIMACIFTCNQCVQAYDVASALHERAMAAAEADLAAVLAQNAAPNVPGAAWLHAKATEAFEGTSGQGASPRASFPLQLQWVVGVTTDLGAQTLNAPSLGRGLERVNVVKPCHPLCVGRAPRLLGA